MLGAVAALPRHVAEAYTNGRAASGLPDLAGLTSVVCCGMGGSAVAGDSRRRAAVGHLTFAMLGALETAGFLPSLAESVDEVVAELERAAADLAPEVPAERNPAKVLATTIGDRIPVIWGIEGVASV